MGAGPVVVAGAELELDLTVRAFPLFRDGAGWFQREIEMRSSPAG